MISRRTVIKGLTATAFGGIASAGYAFGIEPFRLRTTGYRITPEGWPGGLFVRFAVLADVHACRPWMTPERIRSITERTNDLGCDAILLLGDYAAGHRWVTDWVHSDEWGPALAGLRAPLGVYAVLGNHDWWEDKTAQRAGHGPTFAHRALAAAGIRVLENDAVRLEKDGRGFWIAGLGDQIALLPRKAYGRSRWQGVDDLPATLARITDGAPVILMAHEPDIFPKVPRRVTLTLSGHTHGGQVRIAGWSPVVPSRFGNRYAYGHVIEDGRHLIVSGGLGGSIMPLRVGMPPEIVVVEVGS